MQSAQLISAFIFATRIVQSLFFLNTKLQKLYPGSVSVQPGLCLTWSEPQIFGFLMRRLSCHCHRDNINYMDDARNPVSGVSGQVGHTLKLLIWPYVCTVMPLI